MILKRVNGFRGPSRGHARSVAAAFILCRVAALLHSCDLSMSFLYSLIRFRGTTLLEQRTKNTAITHPTFLSMIVTLSPHPLGADLVLDGMKADCSAKTILPDFDAQQGNQRLTMMDLPFLLRCTKTPLTLHIPTAFDNPPT